MLQIISIEKQTAVRANVITNRTGSVEIGIMKAMMIALLKEKIMASPTLYMPRNPISMVR